MSAAIWNRALRWLEKSTRCHCGHALTAHWAVFIIGDPCPPHGPCCKCRCLGVIGDERHGRSRRRQLLEGEMTRDGGGRRRAQPRSPHEVRIGAGRPSASKRLPGSTGWGSLGRSLDPLG